MPFEFYSYPGLNSANYYFYIGGLSVDRPISSNVLATNTGRVAKPTRSY